MNVRVTVPTLTEAATFPRFAPGFAVHRAGPAPLEELPPDELAPDEVVPDELPLDAPPLDAPPLEDLPPEELPPDAPELEDPPLDEERPEDPLLDALAPEEPPPVDGGRSSDAEPQPHAMTTVAATASAAAEDDGREDPRGRAPAGSASNEESMREPPARWTCRESIPQGRCMATVG
jgi:protein TonB